MNFIIFSDIRVNQEEIQSYKAYTDVSNSGAKTVMTMPNEVLYLRESVEEIDAMIKEMFGFVKKKS